ncbi:MAG: L-histidine N(alpha)-methyltransferase [Gammaproteobacteria bacterium]|nr:L-histidine N(alpha)-methyltransferase [Gammaproteobacteria bacterium]
MILHDLVRDVTPAVDGSEKKTVAAIRVPAANEVADLAADIRQNLLQAPYSLPPKYFYDHRGSVLFDQICDTPEYYPTRTESKLLSRYCQHIIDRLSVHHIIELGSGSSRKTRHLFDACQMLNQYPQYWPFDVCEPMLIQTAEELMLQYDWLTVQPLEGDYSAGLSHLPKPHGHSLYVFLGSSIGNFTEQQAVSFLKEVSQHMISGDSLLLGIDRVKDKAVLESAYNDRQGVTAEFNLNVLSVLNNEAGANFKLHQFNHQAVYNETESQIEMYLQSLADQKISFPAINEALYLQNGEKILTEISRKYSLEGIESLLAQAELEITDHFEPANEYFSLILAKCSK